MVSAVANLENVGRIAGPIFVRSSSVLLFSLFSLRSRLGTDRFSSKLEQQSATMTFERGEKQKDP